MNKFIKLTALLSGGLLLSSCGIFNMDDAYVGGEFKKLVQNEQEWSDSVKVIDNLGIEDSYKERLYSHKSENFDFKASGTINEISIQARIESNENGGNMTISCLQYFRNDLWNYGPDIVFKNLKENEMTNKDGYTIRMLDSLNVGKVTYRNILEFDATGAEENVCNYDKFYIAATKGLIRIDLQDSIKIERRD